MMPRVVNPEVYDNILCLDLIYSILPNLCRYLG